VPTTAGMAYSRATREACAARVPASVTMAAARVNISVHAGAVAFATSTSPSRNSPKSCGRCTMRTGPVTPYRRCRMADDHSFADLSLGLLARRGRSRPRSTGPAAGGSTARRACARAATGGGAHPRCRPAAQPCQLDGGHFVAGAEEHVIGLLDRTCRDQLLAEKADAGAQDRQRQGEVTGLFLSGDRIPLIDLQQLLGLGQQPQLTGEGGWSVSRTTTTLG
jgi:hypothetical protein